jgi:hypothetical protein
MDFAFAGMTLATLDDLMVVVEALCLRWPERRLFERTSKMLL